MLKHTYLKLVEMQEEQAKRHLEEVRVIHSEMRGGTVHRLCSSSDSG